MHQRNNNANTTTTFVSPSRSGGVQHIDTVGARLITFSSPSSRSSSLSTSSTTNEVDHRYVPHPLIGTDLTFESCLVFFKIISLFLQYLLLYKSEKWVGPYTTPTDSFIHWRHIDRYVVAILIIFCLSLQQKLYFLQVLINITALVYSFGIYSWKYVLLFTYPLVCSLLINQDQHHHQQQLQQQVPISSNNLPEHLCSTNACELRYETDYFRIEFNQRIRHILFSSFLSSYYICVVPLVFCDTQYIRLDIILLLQYGSILFLSLIMIYTSHYLPLKLLTIFHRNGKHLGSWQCLTSSNTPMISSWDEKNQTAYEPNSVVKYKRHIYRSSNCGLTVAEPGNMFHTRFALLFSRPFVFPLILCSLQIILLMIQIISILFDQRWFVLLSQMILFLFNTYTVRLTARDTYLLYLVYCRE